MKLKLFIPIVLIMLLLMSVQGFGQRVHSYSATRSWEVHLDTTSAIKYDTTKGQFLFGPLYNLNSLEGYIYLEYKLVDSNAGGETIDTTKDSVIYVMKTRGENESIFRIIEIDSIAQGGGGAGAYDTVFFTIDSDSGIISYVYFDFVVSILDSDNTVARDELGVTYKATVFMDAK